MGCCLSTSFCRIPFLHNYLHIKINSIKNLKIKGDISLFHKAGGDLYIKVSYKGRYQSTKIQKSCDSDCVFDEVLIINNSKPSVDECITLQLIDYDIITGDDILGICHIEAPTKKNISLRNRDYDLIGKNGKVIAKIKVDQIHFVKEKINKYDGACKLFCCISCCQNIGNMNN